MFYVGLVSCETTWLILLYLRSQDFGSMEIALIIGIGLIVLYVLFRIFKAFIKWLIIIVIIIFAVAYFSNPEHSVHLEGLKDLAKDLPGKKVADKLRVDDYKIFSLTKVKVDGEEKVVGVGAFGKVWYFDDIEKKLKK